MNLFEGQSFVAMEKGGSLSGWVPTIFDAEVEGDVKICWSLETQQEVGNGGKWWEMEVPES